MIALMLQAVRTSETSVYFESRTRYIPEGSNLQTRRRENLKSQDVLLTFGNATDWQNTVRSVLYLSNDALPNAMFI
jgi:hypothetical protein